MIHGYDATGCPKYSTDRPEYDAEHERRVEAHCRRVHQDLERLGIGEDRTQAHTRKRYRKAAPA